MNYEWKIISLRRKDSPTLNNIIVQVQWKKIGTDENGNIGEFNGATPFELSTVDTNNFIAYEDLTEEIILNWIKSVVIDSYEEHVNSQIEKQIEQKINPVVEVIRGFPWESEEEILSYPPQ